MNNKNKNHNNNKDDNTEDEDEFCLYSLLNIPKNASEQDIVNTTIFCKISIS